MERRRSEARGCVRVRTMPISRRRLAIGIACALWLAVLQLSHLNYLTGIWSKRLQPGRAFASANGCQLTCTLGDATEPGGFAGRPLLLELPFDAELVLPPLNTAQPLGVGLGSETRCKIGHQRGGVLQLPNGFLRLANVASHGDEYLLPESGLLRLPLFNDTDREHSAVSCTPGAHGTKNNDYQNAGDASSFAGRLIMQPHVRCTLPLGTRLKVPNARSLAENQLSSSPLTTEEARQAPEMHRGHVCAKHRPSLRARRLALARSDGRGHAHWVATAAAVHFEAGSRSAGATAFARWKRRKQMLAAHASTVSMLNSGFVGSDSESWPSLSIMFPLQSGRRLKEDSTLETLSLLAHQLQGLSHLPAPNEFRERIQLILLGSKPLCEER